MTLSSYMWPVRKVTRQTAGSVTLSLDTGGSNFYYQPGQYVNLTATIGGVDYQRSYSLSSVCGVHPFPELTIKRIPGGTVSNFLVEQAREGMLLKIDGPLGNFILPAERSGSFVFIATGSGIAPLLPMIHTLLLGENAVVTLLLGNRSVAEIIFHTELDRLQKQFSGRFTVSHALSGESPLPRGISGTTGRLAAGWIQHTLDKRMPGGIPEAFYFLCGVPAMMENISAALLRLGVPETQVYREDFDPAATPAIPPLQHERREVLFFFEDSVRLLEVEGGSTILTAALAAGVPLNHSCDNGSCGACRATRTSGSVTMNRNLALTPEQLLAGDVLLCQSVPVTGDVTIEVDRWQ
ncbi:flavin reductase family protein [Niabella beijingensis]|uniref:flavin reductase family protein n=1 Tax=Niabella beijingensis TaxID=2872700 RepID=UPI001CBB957C|nr:2Fe-2S iron-sulfur cluster-binding protein [Niabella beijingensis]MBZ4192508.1 2Fe-2S iron-sulfur cluster binding domain-containing protein [Niabella beijingensis]